MEIFTGTKEFCIDARTAVAIGKFDGVHVGHRKLLEKIIEQKKDGLRACVFTFDPTPAVYFGFSDGRELSTREEKRELFEKLGVDILVEYPMDSETAGTLAEDFVRRVLVKQLGAKYVAAGTDLSFGYKGAGNAILLQRLAAGLDFEAELIDKVMMDGREVSSTFVRETVEKGDVALAAKLLGDNYKVQGTVIHGRKLGRTLGFPTVNLIPEQTKLMPLPGVYRTTVQVRGKDYKGLTNVGYKPTVSGDERICGIETYIYDFEEEIYGEEILVSFHAFCRPEQKFASVEELKEQIRRDKEQFA